MKKQLEIESFREWLDKRNPRESLLFFLVGLVFFYGIWHLIFEGPLQRQRDFLQQQQEEGMRRLQTQEQNLNAIRQIIASSSFTQNLQKKHQLNLQYQLVGEELKRLERSFVKVQSLSQVTNDIIAQQAEVILISLKTSFREPWLPSAGGQDKTFYDFRKVDKHLMELEFRGSYFNTMAFLNHLEKLPWHLYWDHLDYQVLTYPEAKVVARFYVLSNRKD